MEPRLRITRVVEQVGERGYSICPGFLSPAEVRRLRREAEALWAAGAFRAAGVGLGAARVVRPELRSDWVWWVDEAEATVAQRVYLGRLERLRQRLNRALLLGLVDFEGHLAVYPPGARYLKHLDRFREDSRRVLSCVLYLNDAWDEADGGALRLYPGAAGGPEPTDDADHVDVAPCGGTLVAFTSADLWHEVLPARVPRMSWTGWFRRRA